MKSEEQVARQTRKEKEMSLHEEALAMNAKVDEAAKKEAALQEWRMARRRNRFLYVLYRTWHWENGPGVFSALAMFFAPIYFLLAGGVVLSGWLAFFKNSIILAPLFAYLSFEVKHSTQHGILSSWEKAKAPVFAAVLGMVGPMSIVIIGAYALGYDPLLAVSVAATDTGFGTAVLTSLGTLCPAYVREFLLMLAIGDDLGMVGIIAGLSAAGYGHHVGPHFAWWVRIGFLILMAVVFYLLKGKVERRRTLFALGAFYWGCCFLAGIEAFLGTLPLAWNAKDALTQKVEPTLKRAQVLVIPPFAFLSALIPYTMELAFSGAALLLTAALPAGKYYFIVYGMKYALNKGWCKMQEGVDVDFLLKMVGSAAGMALAMGMCAVGSLLPAKIVPVGMVGIMQGSVVSAFMTIKTAMCHSIKKRNNPAVLD